MKLLSGQPTKEQLGALAVCVAHRCQDHKTIPPMNMSEGNGSSECGACAAEEFGARLSEQALALQDADVVFPILDAYADRLTHHAILMNTLRDVRDRLMLAGLSYADVDAALMGNQ